MSEAEILQGVLLARTQLDTTLTQTISITFALIVAVYYFVHRSSILIKLFVLGLYIIGWLTFMVSGILTADHLNGLLKALSSLAQETEISVAGSAILKSLQSTTYSLFLIMANIVNFIVLFGVIGLLFFWKKPEHDE